MNINEINLLAEKDFEKYKDLIPALRVHNILQPYWLKPEDEKPLKIAFSDSTIEWDSDWSCEYIRPTMIISGEEITKKQGDKLQLFGETWTILEINNGDIMVLCDDYIALKNIGDRSSAWNNCDLKIWLNKWLSDMLKVDNEKKHKKMKLKRKVKIAITRSNFYNNFPVAFIKSLIFVLGISLFVGIPCFFYPKLLVYGSNAIIGIFAGCTIFRILNFLINVLSPHPDTTLRAFLNIILSILCMIFLTIFIEDIIVRISFQLIVLFLSTVIYKYLSVIKYYS